MSSLKTSVTKGLEAMSLTVEGDRTGMTVSDGLDGQKMTLKIDENERVVRVERAICYPVDDFAPELSRAMDWLNQHRAGVCFSYHEAQRALLVSTSWTSPTRDPSPNQLHLLIALVLEAAGRDGPQLERVAEGETSWESLKDAEEEAPAAAARASRFSDPPTRTMNEWPEAGEQATRPMGREPANEGPRVTTKFMDHAGGEEGELADPLPQAPRKPSGIVPTRRFEDLDAFAVKTVDPPEPDQAELDRRGSAQEFTPRKGMSRTALQMAVYRVDNDKADRVDMSAGRRSLGYRLLRGIWMLTLVAVPLGLLYNFIVAPFLGSEGLLDRFKGLISSPPTDQIDPRIPARELLEGRALLAAELSDPLQGELHQAYISRAMNAIDDDATALIELIAGHKNVDVRARAYEHWSKSGFNDDDAARMRLLKAIIDNKRHEDTVDRVPGELLNSLRTKIPADDHLILALPWAQGAPFVTVVELLGRDEKTAPGAKKRSDALATVLDRDTADFQVLRAMVRTGYAPADAAARLVQGRGLEWARGAEGKQQLVQFITESPDSVTPLLKSEDEELRLLAIELLVASGTPGAVDRLGRIGLRDASLRVRLRTAIGLGSVAHSDAAWPLALALGRRDAEQAFVDEVRRAIARLSVSECVAKLREHLATTLPVGERYYAVVALGAVQNAGGLPALLEALRDPDVQVRRKALDVCLELQTGGSNLGSGVAAFRELARSDPDPGVKSVAARLYKAIVGRDP